MKHTLKLFALLLVLCLALSLAACNQRKDSTSASSDSESAATDAEISEATDSPAETEEDDGFEDVVIADNDTIRLVFTKVVKVDGVNFWFDIENKTDRQLIVGMEDSRIFDYWIGDVLWLPLEPKDHVEEYGGVSATDLGFIGIDMPEMISTTLNVYDITGRYFDESMEPLLSQPVTLFPSGLTPETAVQNEHPKNTNETVLAETDDFTVTFLYGEPEPTWPNTGYVYLLRFDNKSDRDLKFSGYNTTLNDELLIIHEGYTRQPGQPTTLSVRPGTHRYYLCEFLGYLFDSLDFTSADVTKVSFDLVVADETDNILYQETVACSME